MLDTVVESCVAHAGVDPNRADLELLSRVPGFRRAAAQAFLAWREQAGTLESKAQLAAIEGVVIFSIAGPVDGQHILALPPHAKPLPAITAASNISWSGLFTMMSTTVTTGGDKTASMKCKSALSGNILDTVSIASLIITVSPLILTVMSLPSNVVAV